MVLSRGLLIESAQQNSNMLTKKTKEKFVKEFITQTMGGELYYGSVIDCCVIIHYLLLSPPILIATDKDPLRPYYQNNTKRLKIHNDRRGSNNRRSRLGVTSRNLRPSFQ